MPDHIHLCLSDLIDQDLSSYEYFHSLPAQVQTLLMQKEISSFEELQECAARVKRSGLAD